MNRRFFFSALAGLKAAPAPAKPRPVLARQAAGECECGLHFYRVLRDDDHGQGGILVCLNRRCRHYDRPFSISYTPMSPADPREVARVGWKGARARLRPPL
jgi:hypothetical protein